MGIARHPLWLAAALTAVLSLTACEAEFSLEAYCAAPEDWIGERVTVTEPAGIVGFGCSLVGCDCCNHCDGDVGFPCDDTWGLRLSSVEMDSKTPQGVWPCDGDECGPLSCKPMQPEEINGVEGVITRDARLRVERIW